MKSSYLAETPDHDGFGYFEGRRDSALISDRKQVGGLLRRYGKVRSRALCHQDSRSSYSGTEGDNCIEVASCPDAIHIRDSKAEQGPQLVVAPAAWSAFAAFAAGR